MESDEKSVILAETLGLKEGKFRVVIIDQHDPSLILEKLGQEKFSETIEYIVNITDSTKMMSQMTHRYFSKFKNCHTYYWPIGRDHFISFWKKYRKKRNTSIHNSHSSGEKGIFDG